MGNVLYEQVFYSLDIIEKDYFGLQFTDANHVKHWLDPTKPIKKQVKSKFFRILNKRKIINTIFEFQLDRHIRFA